jgi:exodeoxyribonuclease VII large subunit
LQDVANQLAQLKKRLPSPQRLLQQQAQRLDEQQQRLERAFSHRHRRSVEQLHHLQQRLAAQRPSRQLQQCEKQLANLVQRLKLSLVQQQSILAHKESQRQQLARRLQMAAPENLLERGYSLTFTAKDGKLVRPGKLPPIGTRLKTQLAGRHFVFSNVVDDRDV